MVADAKACDAARVLRMVGSVNSRTGRTVQVAWVNDFDFDDHGGHRQEGVPVMLYEFDRIADEILRLPREQFEQERAQRLSRAAEKETVGPRCRSGLRKFNRQLLACDRYNDLQRLLCMRGWEHGAPDGERDMPIFVGAVCLAVMRPFSQLRQTIRLLAAQVAPTWTEQQVDNCVHSVLDRAEGSLQGIPNLWNGSPRDARYTPGNDWLLEALAITPDEERELQTIISKTEAKRRAAARAQARRRAGGAQSRCAFLEKSQARRSHAVALRASGLSWAEVGAGLGISAGAARALASRADGQRTGSSVMLCVVEPAAQPPAQNGLPTSIPSTTSEQHSLSCAAVVSVSLKTVSSVATRSMPGPHDTLERLVAVLTHPSALLLPFPYASIPGRLQYGDMLPVRIASLTTLDTPLGLPIAASCPSRNADLVTNSAQSLESIVALDAWPRWRIPALLVATRQWAGYEGTMHVCSAIEAQAAPESRCLLS